MLNDGSENEFAFSCRIASIDDFSDVLVLDEFLDGVQLGFVTSSFWFVFERGWNIGEPVNGFPPIFERFIILIHEFEFE